MPFLYSSDHSFIQRIHEEYTRRQVHSDPEKLAILMPRISFAENSDAGRLVRTDKFQSISAYDEFTTAFLNHYSSHSRLGAVHTLLKISDQIGHFWRNSSDVYKAQNLATSMSNELINQLSTSDWIKDKSMSEKDFQRLVAYFFFLLQLDTATFLKTSDIPFHKSDYVYDVCKKITEKVSPSYQPVRVTHTPSQPHQPPHPPLSPQQTPTPPPQTRYQRGRSPPLQFNHHSSNQNPQFNHHSSNQNPHFNRHSSNQKFTSSPPLARHRSKSRSRNITCRRCNLTGHFAKDCQVVIDASRQ